MPKMASASHSWVLLPEHLRMPLLSMLIGTKSLTSLGFVPFSHKNNVSQPGLTLFCKRPRLGKVGFSHFSCFRFCPFLHPHFFDQAKVEHLGVVWQRLGLVC